MQIKKQTHYADDVGLRSQPSEIKSFQIWEPSSREEADRRCRRVKDKSYYFHVTEARWPSTKLLTPRHPLSRAYEEPLIPRICVAPTVGGCVSAIHSDLSLSKVRIFRTLEPVYAYYPFRVLDSDITGERWLLEPTLFVKMYTFDIAPIREELRGILCGSPKTLLAQKEALENTVRPFLRSVAPWYRLRA